MGFFDNLKDKLMGDQDDYYDDYDDEGYYDDDQPEEQPRTHGVLGNTARAEPESVSVYTRSGRPLGDQTGAGQATPRSGASTARPNPAYAPSYRDHDDYEDETQTIGTRGSYQESSHSSSSDSDSRLKAIPRTSKLPPYVLKPQSYDDVQMVVRRVRTMQPVVISFVTTNIETAKRILDFSLGLSCGINGAVEELGDRVFVVLPQGMELSDSDIDKLVSDGTLEKRPDDYE